MQIRSYKDFVSGTLMIAVGASFATAATNYKIGNAAQIGPGYFPFGLAILLTFLGLIVFAGSFSRAKPREKIDRPDFKILFCIFAGIILFASLLPIIGLVAAIFILVLFSSFASHEHELKYALFVAATLSVLCVITFVYILRLQMPVWPTLFTGG
jgi:putative tricarboxylic transport membrane protein